MLACARMGAIHSVVFAGFSADALAQRIVAAQSTVLVTADIGRRAGKTVELKSIVNAARKLHNVEDLLHHVLVWERFFHESKKKATRDATEEDAAAEAAIEAAVAVHAAPYEMLEKDVRMNVLTANQRPYYPPASMDAEDELFYLFTSGSTGNPKGVVHTTAGYALYAAFTTHHTFHVRPNDLFACVADCGWITGHTCVQCVCVPCTF
jgi:acetyl-CoA synthetase